MPDIIFHGQEFTFAHICAVRSQTTLAGILTFASCQSCFSAHMLVEFRALSVCAWVSQAKYSKGPSSTSSCALCADISSLEIFGGFEPSCLVGAATQAPQGVSYSLIGLLAS